MGGMKVGSSHKWKYDTENWNETKIAPRKWAFTYVQSKGRKGRTAPRGSGMPIGSKLIWNIRAKQYAIKISPNKYKLIMKGIKTQDNAQVKGKWINKRKRRRTPLMSKRHIKKTKEVFRKSWIK